MMMAPFWMFMYWLFFTNGRWYQGIFSDFIDLEICDLKFPESTKLALKIREFLLTFQLLRGNAPTWLTDRSKEFYVRNSS